MCLSFFNHYCNFLHLLNFFLCVWEDMGEYSACGGNISVIGAELLFTIVLFIWILIVKFITPPFSIVSVHIFFFCLPFLWNRWFLLIWYSWFAQQWLRWVDGYWSGITTSGRNCWRFSFWPSASGLAVTENEDIYFSVKLVALECLFDS